MKHPLPFDDAPTPGNRARGIEAVSLKLADAMTPGFEAEFSPFEAEAAGAFAEEALTEQDARESVMDMKTRPSAGS